MGFGLTTSRRSSTLREAAKVAAARLQPSPYSCPLSYRFINVTVRARSVAWFNTPACQAGERRFKSGRARQL